MGFPLAFSIAGLDVVDEYLCLIEEVELDS